MKCDALKAEMTAWRRDFHRHPELGFQEERTSRIVAKLLTSFGLEVYKKNWWHRRRWCSEAR